MAINMQPSSESLSSQSTPIYGNPSTVLRRLHLAGSGGLFTDNQAYESDMITLGYSAYTDSPMWNTALINSDAAISSGKFELRISQAENALRSLDRRPSFYVVDEEQSQDIHNLIVERGYKLSWRDAWLTSRLETLLTDSNLHQQIKLAIDASSKDDFIQVQFNAHSGEVSPDNPYGEILPGETSGLRHSLDDRVRRDIGYSVVTYEDNCEEPISTATVTVLGELACLSSIATIPGKRHLGYARLAIQAALREAAPRMTRFGNLSGRSPFVCLATEPDQRPYQIFKEMGFEHSFSAQGYVLSD